MLPTVASNSNQQPVSFTLDNQGEKSLMQIP